MASWILHLITWLFLALAHLLLPIGLFHYRPGEGRARRLTVVYGGLTAAWGLSGALTTLAEPALAVGELASLIFLGLAPAIAGLAVVLERAFAGEDGNWLWGIVGSAWGALVLAIGLYSRQSGNVTWVCSVLAALGWVALWTVSAVMWVRWYVQMEWAFQRNRSLYWTWASVPLVVGQALALFAPWPADAIGLLLHLGGLAAIAVAVTLRHLPNVRAALRQGFRFVVLASLTAVLLVVGLLVLSLLPRPQPFQSVAIGLVAVVAVVLPLVYRLFHDLVMQLAERLIPRTGYDLDEKISEYSLAIGNIIDLEQLATVAAGTTSEVLDVQRAALILVTKEAHEVRLRALKGMGDIPQEEVSLDVHSPVVERLGEQRQPLFQHDMERDPVFQGIAPEEQEWLQKMGMEVYMPIFAKSIFVGILAVGPPRSGEPFGRRDQAFLSTLVHQTAIALQNARMFDDMRELNFEIIQLNEDLRRANERLERLDRAKTDFLTVASHELRTPLTQVKGYADMLAELSAERAITTEQVIEITHDIGRAADRLGDIVKAMVDLSQIEVDALNLFFAPTTLKAVMRIALEPWVQPMQLRRQHLTVEGVGDIPPIVADLQWLSQAFSNLVSNAIKYTPDGGSIVIQAQQIDDASFEVVVADTGVGIDLADQEFVFDKFFRVGDPDRHSSGKFNFKGGGPGLGLSIARGVVEAHGGRVWVVSEGCDEVCCPGSAFHVVLPLQACPPAPESSSTELPTTEVMPFTVWPEELGAL